MGATRVGFMMRMYCSSHQVVQRYFPQGSLVDANASKPRAVSDIGKPKKPLKPLSSKSTASYVSVFALLISGHLGKGCDLDGIPRCGSYLPWSLSSCSLIDKPEVSNITLEQTAPAFQF